MNTSSFSGMSAAYPSKLSSTAHGDYSITMPTEKADPQKEAMDASQRPRIATGAGFTR